VNRKEVLDTVAGFSRREKIQWLLRLGFALTIAARDDYPSVTPDGDINHLIAFNEMQHLLLQEILHMETGEHWAIEHLLDNMHAQAASHGVVPSFRSVINASLS
jgi:hypothetical protein